MIKSHKVKNCTECGKLFLYTGNELCRDCLVEREKKMAQISSYIRDNPRCSVKEVCEALDVKASLIYWMLRRGYLIEQETSFKYPCKKCGAMIYYGRYCRKCESKMLKSLEKQKAQILQKQKKVEDNGAYSSVFAEQIKQ